LLGTHSQAVLLAVVLLLAVAGCSKCGKQGAAPAAGVERVLPLGAEVYVIAPSVEKLGQKLSLLEGLKVANFGAQAGGFENAHAYVDALVAELGIDLRSKEQLDKIGVAAGSSAGVAMFAEDALLALPIKDEGRIGAFIRTYSANRLGASMVEDKVENGVTVHRFLGANAPKLAWASVNGYALVAPQRAIDKLAGWASRGESDTLAKDPALPASLARLPADRDAIIYAPAGTKETLALPVSHVVIALSLDARAFTLTADAPWAGDKASLSLFEPKPQAAPLLGLLPNDAFLVARFAGEASQLGPLLSPVLGQRLQAAFSEGGFDLNAVLAQVAPGSVVGLSLAPTAQMGGGVPELDIRRTNPFAYVHLSGAAPAKSAEAIGPALEKLAAAAPKFGAQIALKDGVWVTTYAQGEGVHFAAKGDRVVFGSPIGRVAALVASDGNGAGPTAELKKALESSAIGAVVDLRKLSDAVRELPPSAWGIGGFAIKATTLRWLDNSDDLRAVTVTVGTKGGAVQAQAQLLLGAPPK